ncbi:hypothetical protein [Pedobacter aquatilis]|uniref:hypothetical protein n=1 Tax=Pedobacter aquatilis TaxID=351343 RepID=UPI00292D96BF|nr:hypothetical protein [Pedobacter aquatilis]
MKNHTLNYHKNSLLLVFMITIPLLGALLLLIALLSIPKDLFGTISVVVIVSSVILMAGIFYWGVNKEINIPCNVVLNEKGIGYKFLKKSLFYKNKDFYAGWENVTGISEVFCTTTGKYFYRLKFQNPKITVNLSPSKNNESDAEAVFAEIDYYQDTFSIPQAKTVFRKQSAQKLAQV